MNGQHTEYNHDKVTFVLTPTKLAVQTSLQFFVLVPAETYYKKRWHVICGLIRMGEITSISELADYSNGRLLWHASRREWL